MNYKIWMCEILEDVTSSEKPGTILCATTKEGLCVATGNGVLEITEIQAPNSKRMLVKDYLRGNKIVEGKIGSFYKDFCLMEQAYVKNPDITVKQLIEESTLQMGEKITIRRFVRFVMGEGLEKRKDDVAEEVMKQAQGK